MLLFEAVGYAVSLALSAATKIEYTQRKPFRHLFEEVEPLQSGATQSMHEHHADVGRLPTDEERSLEVLFRTVGDLQRLVLDVFVLTEVFP